MPDISFVTKSMFFDRKGVIDAVRKSKRGPLSKIGAFIRRRARSLTGKKSKNSADPGKPPKSHLDLLHSKIQFGYDASRESVVIGPEKINNPNADAMEMLEFGGTTKRIDPITGEKKTAHYRGNPFMAPSLTAEIEAGTVSSAWKDAVKR